MPLYLYNFCIFAVSDVFLYENEDIHQQADT